MRALLERGLNPSRALDTLSRIGRRAGAVGERSDAPAIRKGEIPDMTKPATKMGVMAGAVVALGLMAFPALAQTTPDNKDALKCQTNQGKTTAKFVSSKAKCGQK